MIYSRSGHSCSAQPIVIVWLDSGHSGPSPVGSTQKRIRCFRPYPHVFEHSDQSRHGPHDQWFVQATSSQSSSSNVWPDTICMATSSDRRSFEHTGELYGSAAYSGLILTTSCKYGVKEHVFFSILASFLIPSHGRAKGSSCWQKRKRTREPAPHVALHSDHGVKDVHIP